MTKRKIDNCIEELISNPKAKREISNQIDKVRSMLSNDKSILIDDYQNIGQEFRNDLRENVLGSKSSCSEFLR